MQAYKLISNLVPTLSMQDTGARALDLMDEFHLEYLPLLQHNKLVGLVSENDILDFEDTNLKFSSIDTDYLQIQISKDAHVYEALKICSQMQINVLPVLDEAHNYVGSITQENLFNYISSGTQCTENGAIIILEIEQQNYSLSQVAGIFESENIIMLSVQIHTDELTNNLLVTIKCNKNNLQTVVPTFERMGYNIIELYGEQADYNNLKDNYESLMHFINI
jgi:acetoin utilization protein AcuB